MYVIMTFTPNGNPFPIERVIYSTKEDAERRLNELKIIYNSPMYISSKLGGINNASIL